MSMRSWKPRCPARLGWALTLCLFAPQLHAGALTDGTVGAVQSLSGNFTIPQTLGKISGANLFHSFANFSVNSGESATFTTTDAFRNVISRVTGGSPSSINGLLRLAPAAGSAPEFFFINPAGVTFGAGASIDVPAGFHVSTANYLKFADGNFYADTATASTFSSAPPEAFGFLGTTRASVDINNGAALATQPLQQIDVAAGDVRIDNAGLVSNGGDIRVAAVAQTAQEVGLAGALPDTNGALEVSNGGYIDASGSGADNGGNVYASAGNITVDGNGNQTVGTTISSNAWQGSSGNAGNVDVRASGTLSVLDGGTISSDTYTSGNAGQVTVNAGTVAIDGRSSTYFTGISSDAISGSSGSAGNVGVTANGALSVLNGGSISSTTSGAGIAGSVSVGGNTVLVDGAGSSINASATSSSTSGEPGVVSVRATGSITVSGAGAISVRNNAQNVAAPGAVVPGYIEVAAPTVAVNGGSITASTSGNVDAGYVVVNSSFDAAGKRVVSTTSNVTVTNGGKISSTTSGAGAAGLVDVSGKTVLLDGSASIRASALQGSTGNAGDVGITVDGAMSVLNGSTIASDVSGSGHAGNVTVNAGTISVDGQGGSNLTYISSDALQGSSGKAGNVSVTASGALSILSGGWISSDTYASGDAGQVTINAATLTVDAKSSGKFTGISSDAISGSSGNAGNVGVTASGALSVLNGGSISSTTGGAGIAGSVSVDGKTVLVDGAGSSINASATSSSTSGEPGVVSVHAAGSITVSGGGEISVRNDAVVANPGAVLPGYLEVAAPNVAIDGGSITANTSGNVDAGLVLVNTTFDAAGNLVKDAANSVAVTNGGQISSTTSGAGAAGLVDVSGKTVSVAGSGSLISAAATRDSTSGKTGYVSVIAAESLGVSAGGKVSVRNDAANVANAGAVVPGYIEVAAPSVAVDGGSITASTSGAVDAGLVLVNTTLDAAGNRVASTTNDVSVTNGGRISSTTSGAGYAGVIDVSGKTVLVEGSTSDISAAALQGSGGNAGIVGITVSGTLSVVNGGVVTSRTSSSGDAGGVAVNAGTLIIDGRGSSGYTGISSSTLQAGGNAGNVDITVGGMLSVLNGGSVTSDTYTSGRAGHVTVNSGTITVDGQGGGKLTYISSDALQGSSGNAGNVSVTASAALSVVNGGTITSDTYASGNAGHVTVNAGTIIVDDRGGSNLTWISSDAISGTGNAGNVSVQATGALSILNGATVSSDTYTSGNAGQVTVKAGSLAVDGHGSVAMISSRTWAGSTGDAGNVDVTVDGALSVLDGGQISSDTKASGKAGNVSVTASGALSILNGGWISSDTYASGDAGHVSVNADTITVDAQSSGFFTGISSDALAGSSGNAGNVGVTASGALSVRNGGSISSTTAGGGYSGSVSVGGKTIRVDGAGSSINAAATATSTSGESGSVSASATDSITVSNGGEISVRNDAVVTNPGAAIWGNLDVAAPSVVVDGGSISASTSGNVDAGFVTVNSTFDAAGNRVTNTTSNVSVTHGGNISSTTSGAGAAGFIDVSGKTILVDGTGSSISAAATKDSASGQTGYVDVAAAQSINISNGGEISISNDATVADPSVLAPTQITVGAPGIVLRNARITSAATGNVAASDIAVSYDGHLYLDPSAITTSAVDGNGGSITLAGKGPLILDHSQVTSSVSGLTNGNGGNISISAKTLGLNTGFIQANTTAPTANGGNVTISSDTVLSSGNDLLVGGAIVPFDAARFNFNVIQATAPSGVNGEINISSPQIDLSGTFASLATQFMDFGNLGMDICQCGAGSSLTPVGQGGLRPTSSDWLRP